MLKCFEFACQISVWLFFLPKKFFFWSTDGLSVVLSFFFDDGRAKTMNFFIIHQPIYQWWLFTQQSDATQPIGNFIRLNVVCKENARVLQGSGELKKARKKVRSNFEVALETYIKTQYIFIQVHSKRSIKGVSSIPFFLKKKFFCLLCEWQLQGR